MNKLVYIALLAFACQVASAQNLTKPEDVEEDSEYFFSDDNTEVAQLTDQTRIFEDFCKYQRDFVTGDLRSRSHGYAADFFRLFFKTVSGVGTDAMETQKEAIDRLGEQLKNPDAAIAEGSTEVEEIIAEGQREIQANPSQPNAFIRAIVSTLSATKATIASKVALGINVIKGTLDVKNVIAGLNEVCNSLKGYEATIRENFAQTRDALAEHDASLANIQLEDVKCVTVGRVLSLEAVCNLVKAAQAPLMKIFSVARGNRGQVQA